MRLIDADALFDVLYRAWGTEMDVGPASEFMEMINNAPTITPPPNDPLTLEELREMDGEPVWVADLLIPDCSCYHFTQKIDGHILLMEPRYYPAEDVMIPHYCADDENQGYGRTWLTYRRKPGDTGQ